MQISEQKSKALHDGCCNTTPLGVRGPGLHTGAGTTSQPHTSVQSDAAFPVREHGRAGKGRKPAETKSRGCKLIPTANLHENAYTPVTSVDCSFLFQIISH